MVEMFAPQPYARSVVQPEPAFLGLSLRDFKPFTPDPFCVLMIYVPASVVRHPGDHVTTKAPELSGQFDDVLRQPLFI